MGVSLNQPSRVREVGAERREPLLPGDSTGDGIPGRGYPEKKHRLTPCQQPR